MRRLLLLMMFRNLRCRHADPCNGFNFGCCIWIKTLLFKNTATLWEIKENTEEYKMNNTIITAVLQLSMYSYQSICMYPQPRHFLTLAFIIRDYYSTGYSVGNFLLYRETFVCPNISQYSKLKGYTSDTKQRA
jgi:hypothetical protein